MRTRRMGIGLGLFAGLTAATAAWAVLGTKVDLPTGTATFADGRTFTYTSHFYRYWTAVSGGQQIGLNFEEHDWANCADAIVPCNGADHMVRSKQTSGTVYTQSDKFPYYQARLRKNGATVQTRPAFNSGYLGCPSPTLNEWNWSDFGLFANESAAARATQTWDVVLSCHEQTGPGSWTQRSNVISGSL